MSGPIDLPADQKALSDSFDGETGIGFPISGGNGHVDHAMAERRDIRRDGRGRARRREHNVEPDMIIHSHGGHGGSCKCRVLLVHFGLFCVAKHNGRD